MNQYLEELSDRWHQSTVPPCHELLPFLEYVRQHGFPTGLDPTTIAAIQLSARPDGNFVYTTDPGGVSFTLELNRVVLSDLLELAQNDAAKEDRRVADLLIQSTLIKEFASARAALDDREFGRKSARLYRLFRPDFARYVTHRSDGGVGKVSELMFYQSVEKGEKPSARAGIPIENPCGRNGLLPFFNGLL